MSRLDFETDRILAAFFDEIEKHGKGRYGSMKELHENLGRSPAYLYGLRRKWREEGQRTGFDLQTILQVLLAMEIEPAEFFATVYAQKAMRDEEGVAEVEWDDDELPDLVKGLGETESGGDR